MRNVKNLGWASVGVLLTMQVTGRAGAQEWLADRQRTEGPGIRVGDLELHPGIGVEAGYDSNVYLSDEAPDGIGILRVTPHFYVSTLGPSRGVAQPSEGEGSESSAEGPAVAFRAGGSGSYMYYFEDKQPALFDATGLLDLSLFPGRPFSVRLFDNFTRTSRPTTEPIGADFSKLGASDYGRDINELGLDLRVNSSGQILSAVLGYTFGLDYYEGSVFAFGSSFEHRGRLGASWKFLPMTALVFNSEVAARLYPDDDNNAKLTAVNDSVRYSGEFGINGAFTSTLSFSALLGYNAAFVQNADDFESITATAEMRWRPELKTKLSLGYNRRFAPSLVGSMIQNDTIYLRADTVLLGAWLVGIDARVGFMDYGDLTAPNGTLLGTTRSRNDIYARAGLFTEYRFTDWLGLNATLTYTGTTTDYKYRLDTVGGTDSAAYQKFEAWAGLRAFY